MIVSPNPIIVRAPGKLILSGEHAVVYGAPALAMAIDRWFTVRLFPRTSEAIHFFSGEGKLHLAEHALHVFRARYAIFDKPGADLYLSSQLWSGSGTGSSAALIVVLIKVFATYWQVAITDDELLTLAIEIEHFAHGRSSGLDVHVCSRGGMGLYFFSSGKLERMARTPTQLPFLLIYTGTPGSSTADCVQHVKTKLLSNFTLLNAFRDVTEATDRALQHNHFSEWKNAMQENHRLLCEIGVVPAEIDAFIKKLEKCGGAAKICGAGSIQGASAGILLAIHEDMQQLARLAVQHHFTYTLTQCAHRGLHGV